MALSSIAEMNGEVVNNVLIARRKYELSGIIVCFKVGDRIKGEQIITILRDFLPLLN